MVEKIIGIYGVHDISDDDFPSLIHDHSVSIMEDGKIAHFVQLERHLRNKYDARFPQYAENIIRSLGLASGKGIMPVFCDHEIGRAFLSTGGKLRHEVLPNAPLVNRLEEGIGYWFGNRLKSYSINHELAHIYSCIPFYGDFQDGDLLIHYDGGASRSNFSAWHWKSGEAHLIEAHYDLKPLTALFNANALSFAISGTNYKSQNATPGKLMGLAPYGKPDPKIESWLAKHGFFQDIWRSKKTFYEACENELGVSLSSINTKDTLIQDIAATIHEVFMRESFCYFDRLAKYCRTGRLFYSGGVALNIKFNSLLHASGLFNNIFIPPCPSDTGLSLGAAVIGSMLQGREVEISSPYLNNFGIEAYCDYSYNKETLLETAKLIYAGKVIGICNGYGKAGPRALGNRSILARADSAELAGKVSMKLKKREWYRPVAPIMLHEHASQVTGLKNLPLLAKYMLMDFAILEDYIPAMEGCVHVDGTSRIQVISKKEENPFIYELLHCCYECYGLIALINTSFNSQGEPIVHAPDDAKKSAMNMNLDALVLNGKLQIFN